MKIYLDTCSLQRPLDTKNQLRILLESEAVLGIVALCEANVVELVASDALAFEVARNPHSMRRVYAEELLMKAKSVVVLETKIEKRAAYFANQGIRPLDALHLASAEAGKADFLCTCDDQFLKQASKIEDLKTRVVSPLDLIKEIEP